MSGVFRVVGLGGIGQVVATHLARYLASRAANGAGPGSAGAEPRLVLIDGDAYEERNQARMECPDFGNKAEAMRDRIIEQSGDTHLTVVAIPEYLTPENVARLVPGGPDDTLFVCVDNHASRKLVADHVEHLADACVVSGGNDGVGVDSRGVARGGTYGSVQVFVRCGGGSRTATMTTFHPEIADPADVRPDELGCADQIASGAAPQLLFTNLMTAAAMLAAWYALDRGELRYGELALDIVKGRMGPVLPLPEPIGAG